jgi:PAS domain S-box-containing protein
MDPSESSRLLQLQQEIESLGRQAREFATTVPTARLQTLEETDAKREALALRARDLATNVEMSRIQILNQSDFGHGCDLSSRIPRASMSAQPVELLAVAPLGQDLEIGQIGLRLLVENVLDYAILLLDLKGHVLTWNKGAERLKGYARDEIIGRHFSIFYPPDDVAAGKPARELQIAEEKGRFEDENWRVRKDGTRFWANVVITALRDETGTLRGFGKVTRDFTIRKRAEEDKFQMAVESAPNAMVIINADGQITLVNAQTEKMFGYPRAELLGKCVELLVPDRFRDRHLVDRRNFFGDPHTRSIGSGRELLGRRKDASEFPIEIGLNPVPTAEGSVVISAIVDVTDRKRAEQVLHEAYALLQKKNRRLARLSRTAREFVDNVSHEFRTPLTVIKEYASLVRDGVVGAVSDEQKSMLTVVEDRADDMNTMVDDMLDVSQLKSGLLGIRRQECRVEEILKHVRPGLERKAAVKGVELEFEVEPLLPTLFCDPEKAGRVLINLTTNAIKFCGHPGRVRLSCQRESDGTGVKFGVSDNGNGISPENQEAIFRRFKQLGGSDRSSTKGFGLGLNIAKQLVELNLGAISVESQVGHGSTFFFTLPPADPREVLRRYLKWIEHRRNGSTQLALVEANVEGSTSATLADDANLFLNHLLRSTDLLFRRGPTQWLVVLPVAEIEVAEFCERVAKKRGVANRNRLGGPLPDIRMKFLCSWRVGSDREELLNRLSSALNPAEVHSVRDHIPPLVA